MPDSLTPQLALPYLMPSQAQKHVTHNEALRILDGLVQLSVRGRTRATPPDAPADGERHIVGAGASGAWAGWDGTVACFVESGWMRLVPRTGWRAWVEDEGALLVFDGAAWIGTTATEQQNLAMLGLGTAADAANPFAAKLNAALWTARAAAEGGDGDLRLTLNKETAADVLSLLFQSGYSARAELGLTGSDDLTLKVSPDGETWLAAFTVERATGTLRAGALSVGTDPGAADGVPLVLGRDDPASLRLHQSAAYIHLVPHPAGTADWDAALSYSPADRKWHIGDAAQDSSLVLRRGDANATYARMAASEIGSISFLKNTTSSFVSHGQHVSGSSLAYSDARGTGIAQHTAPVAGTWRALSFCGAGAATTFVRIA